MPITTLPNPGMDFTPLTPLTAEEMDDIVENIEAINNATIQTGSIADGAVTKAKLSADALSASSYSTSEVQTGATWIDGKPIYKKSFTHHIESASSSSSYSITAGISNFGNLVNFEAMRERKSSSYNELAPLAYASGSNYATAYYDSSTGKIEVEWNITGYGGSTLDDTITLYYTKTS